MANVNKVTVMGVLGRDPETKNFPNGGSITTFSVATSEHWKDKVTGERKEATDWHRIAANNRLGEIASLSTLRKAARSISKAYYAQGSGKTKEVQKRK